MARSKQARRQQELVPTGAPANGIYYRCPACGQDVDQTDRLAVSQHHQHVLHPYLFRELLRQSSDTGQTQITSEE